jgi:transcription initiation factor TFIIF subunit alpha
MSTQNIDLPPIKLIRVSVATQASQAGTPTPGGSPPPGQAPDRIQPWEIAEALAPYAKEGISLGALLRKFQRRMNGPGNITKTEWIQMVKANAVYGPDKLLRPKPGGASPQP